MFLCLFFLYRREACNEGEGDPPLYVNVNMFNGQIMNTWIDSLQAFFPGLQVCFFYSLFHFQHRIVTIITTVTIVQFKDLQFVMLVLVFINLGYKTDLDWNLATLDIFQTGHLFIFGLAHLWSLDLHLHFPRWSVEQVDVPPHIEEIRSILISIPHATYSTVFQVLNGDVENAICLHAFYYAIWRRFGALPERYNWQLQAPDVLFYPLRPELVESTYLLYQVQTHSFMFSLSMSLSETFRNKKYQVLALGTMYELFFLSEPEKCHDIKMSSDLSIDGPMVCLVLWK